MDVRVDDIGVDIRLNGPDVPLCLCRSLWDTYRDGEVLVIDTTQRRPSRVVLHHPYRERLAWWVNERR